MKPSLPLLNVLLLAAWHATGAEGVTTAPQWQEIELTFTASRDTANPYTDTEVWAEFTHDDGTKLRRPMFWDGGRTLRVRFASTKSSGVCLSWTAPGGDGATLPHGTVSGLKRGCVSRVLETRNSLRSSQVFRPLVSGFQGLYGAKREDNGWILPGSIERGRQASGLRRASLSF